MDYLSSEDAGKQVMAGMDESGFKLRYEMQLLIRTPSFFSCRMLRQARLWTTGLLGGQKCAGRRIVRVP